MNRRTFIFGLGGAAAAWPVVARAQPNAVQAPTKYELSINLKAANSLGLEGPQQSLARADKVIE